VLRRVEVRDFQSVHSADIALGQFTVVTGPNNSGKSALFRALYLLARNGRGVASYVSAGRKTFTVSAVGDEWAVRLARSVSPRGKNEYVLAVNTGGSWDSVTSTKLAGQVPDDVAAVLGLSELNFASQHAGPYLLDVPGTEVARRLGVLTNVSLVLGAAAEANRVRKQLQRDLEGARERRDALLAEAQEFAGLRAQRAAVAAAEEALGRLEAVSARCRRLTELADRLELSELARENAARVAAGREPPSLDRLERLAARYARLYDLAGQLQTSEHTATRGEDEAEAAQAAEREATARLHDVLAAAGRCPTCGQAVS
jgi:energy-coupling factor transporter ATP-binding protein EcfA2